MKITDNKTVIVEEACESVKGFRADVPRYIAINLKGTFSDFFPQTNCINFL